MYSAKINCVESSSYFEELTTEDITDKVTSLDIDLSKAYLFRKSYFYYLNCGPNIHNESNPKMTNTNATVVSMTPGSRVHISCVFNLKKTYQILSTTFVSKKRVIDRSRILCIYEFSTGDIGSRMGK